MKFNSQLAEISGIHAGDGYLRNDGKRREWDISGNIEEKDYYDKHVIPLFNSTFNLKIKGRFFQSRNTYGFVIRDREVIEFAHDMFGFPYGKKTLKVTIPKFIFQTSFLQRSFLRGYFDTDGCLTFGKRIYNSSIFKKTKNYYPIIALTTCSKNLAKNIKYLITKFGFRFSMSLYKPKKLTENLKYRFQIVGLKELYKWMRLIGSKNPSKISRYLIWRKFGFCPPNTTYKQRESILSGKLNPNLLYGPVA